MRQFARLSLLEPIPDKTTILNFRHLLERHGLAAKLLEAVNHHLQGRGVLLWRGTIVDATIIDAPSSTKNRSRTRDPEMHQTKKGNQWFFGMKVHIGVDRDSREAPVPGDQAAVRLHEGPLPRSGEEHRATEHPVCSVEPVDGAQAIVDDGGEGASRDRKKRSFAGESGLK